MKEQPINLEIQSSQVLSELAQEEKKKQVWSSMLSPGEKQKAFNAGQSMDSKKVTEALGFLDMKQICYCLAQALMKHIEFGKGFFFLPDLQKYLKHCEEKQIDDKPTNTNLNLEFTYDLGEMKIAIPPPSQVQKTKSSSEGNE